MESWKSETLQIAICDDEPLILEQLTKLVEEVLKKTGKTFTIETFLSGRDLIKQIRMYHIVFLDIEMPEMDGIQTGWEILKRNPECKMVIMSDSMERFTEILQIKAFWFLTKPFDIEKIREVVKAYENQMVESEEIKVFYKRKSFWISRRDIRYIVTNGGAVKIVTENQVYRKDIPLKELKKILDTREFFQVNRQYMVNLPWITIYEEGVIHMGEQEILVARRRKRDFEKVYNDFSISICHNRNCN